MKVRKLIDTCIAFPNSVKIMGFNDKLGRYETIWSGQQYDVPTDLLKIQVNIWDIHTEIVKVHDYAGEVVGEIVLKELRIYTSEAT